LEDRIFKEGRTSQMSRLSKYSPEFRERAVRLARESQSSISQVARDLGMHPETLRIWVRQDEANDGSRADRLATVEREELVSLRREVRDLRRANEILKAARVDSTGRRNTSSVEVLMGRPAGWMMELTGRSPMKSPGAPALRRDVERSFWREITKGLTSENAAIAVGASQAAGSRWFRERP